MKDFDRLKEDPGDPLFADLAEELRRGGELIRAMEICLRGLSANPACHKGRLVLARVFYELRYLPFALREIEELCRALPHSRSLQRLREKLSPEVSGAEQQEETVAEADFDFEDLELIDEDEESPK